MLDSAALASLFQHILSKQTSSSSRPAVDAEWLSASPPTRPLNLTRLDEIDNGPLRARRALRAAFAFKLIHALLQGINAPHQIFHGWLLCQGR